MPRSLKFRHTIIPEALYLFSNSGNTVKFGVHNGHHWLNRDLPTRTENHICQLDLDWLLRAQLLAPVIRRNKENHWPIKETINGCDNFYYACLLKKVFFVLQHHLYPVPNLVLHYVSSFSGLVGLFKRKRNHDMKELTFCIPIILTKSSQVALVFPTDMKLDQKVVHRLSIVFCFLLSI